MKVKQLFIVAVILLTAKSNAQIKVFAGGSVSIGATTSPTANSVNHQLIGARIAFPGSTSAITSAALIIGQTATTTAPAYTFWADELTGIAHPGTNVLGITINNSEKFRFNTSGQILNSNNSSSESTPEYSWKNNSNTGMFRYGTDILAFSTGGTERFRINSNGQLLKKGGPNSASTPDFSWENDPNTGIFWQSADVMGFSSNGSERMRITNAGNILMGTTTQSNGERVVITGASNQQPLSIYTSHSTDAGYGEIIWVNQHHTKAFSIISSATGTLTETAFIYGNGDAWGKSWYGYSDKSLKENIDSLQNSLTKIKQLKGVSYNFKSSFVGSQEAGKKQIGLIAQEVEKVIPEVIGTNENGLKGIAYQNIIPFLIEAIKEQDKQITQLQNDVNNCCSKSNNRLINQEENNSETGNINKTYIKQNSPNPFSRETLIEYFIAEKNANASILIFDMNGRLLKTLKLNGTGNGSVTISGNDLQPGMYYYSLLVNQKEIDTKKMILTEQ